MAAATPLDVAIPLPPRRLASEQIDSSSEARRRAEAEAAAPLSSAAAAFAERAPVALPATDAAVVRPRNWWRRASMRGQVRGRGSQWGSTG